jgi:hypothetical protein
MTGTEPHAPRGTAGRGPNWDRGPCAGYAGAARHCTKRHRRPWAQPGPPAVDWPRRLRVDACASRHRRPRDHSWDRGPHAGRRSCSTRSGKLRVDACASRHRRPRDHSWDRGPHAGWRSCSTRSGKLRVVACASWHRRPRDHSWDRGPHAGRRSCSTRSGKLRVDACTPRHRRPRDHSWDRGLRAGRRSCATRSGPTRLRMPTLAPPAAGPARGPWAAGGPEEQRDSDWLHGLCRDEVTVCFHYLYRRSRLVMSRRNFLSKLLSSEE